MLLLLFFVVLNCNAFQQIPPPPTRLVVVRPDTTSRKMTSASSSDDINIYFNTAITLTPAATQVGMNAALAKAAKEGWEVTICIADVGGTPLHVQRTAQAFPASYEIACGKAKSAALFAKNTGALEDAVNVSGGRSALLSSPYLLMRGGMPIMWEGRVCGSVGVSGVQAHQDEAVAQAAVDAMGKVLVGTPEVRSRL